MRFWAIGESWRLEQIDGDEIPVRSVLHCRSLDDRHIIDHVRVDFAHGRIEIDAGRYPMRTRGCELPGSTAADAWIVDDRRAFLCAHAQQRRRSPNEAASIGAGPRLHSPEETDCEAGPRD